MNDQDTLAALQAENARLIAQLEVHGIEWRLPPPPARKVRDIFDFVDTGHPALQRMWDKRQRG
jgi:hypothetical protein